MKQYKILILTLLIISVGTGTALATGIEPADILNGADEFVTTAPANSRTLILVFGTLDAFDVTPPVIPASEPPQGDKEVADPSSGSQTPEAMAVPEPATLLLLGGGLLIVFGIRRRAKHSR